MIRVLLVDDDEDLRQSLAELLMDEGLQVTQAVDGRDALARLADIPVDLILLDYMMPEMDGLAFRQVQRANSRLADIPVILLTAATASSGRDAIVPDRLLEKPFRFSVLLASIRELLAERQGG
ncbi:MAG TPA: response regulator [Polyangia bacterium]|jgi:CheY-like chemotaxis protein|nr:response regulator [Polyangia bacterium]